MVALDGQVEDVNDAFVESLGWSRDAWFNAQASSLLADIPKAVLFPIFCIAGSVLTRMLYRPLREITRVAVALAAGKLEISPSVPSNDRG
jgi:PAS domain-containing protein